MCSLLPAPWVAGCQVPRMSLGWERGSRSMLRIHGRHGPARAGVQMDSTCDWAAQQHHQSCPTAFVLCLINSGKGTCPFISALGTRSWAWAGGEGERRRRNPSASKSSLNYCLSPARLPPPRLAQASNKGHG